MTLALCFRCGNVKFGAICPCERCGLSSTGNIQLDIAFSDHHLSHQQLQFFGSVVEAIRKVSDDDVGGFWTFIRYVSAHHPSILTANVPPDLVDRVNAITAKVEWPKENQPPAASDPPA
jgi:hypothetical protein